MTSALQTSLPNATPSQAHMARRARSPSFLCPPELLTPVKIEQDKGAERGSSIPIIPPPRRQPLTWQARAVIGGVSDLAARPPVLAGRGVAGHVEMLAVLPGVRRLAEALVGAHLVGAAPAVLADGRRDAAFIDVLLAVGPVEARGASADVVGFEGEALAPIGAGVGGAGVSLLAGFA